MNTTSKNVPLAERLILVRFRLSDWSGRKYDKLASDQFVQMLGTDPNDDTEQPPKDSRNVGRFNKLLVERKSLLAVHQAKSELINRHKFLTAPWTDNGVRVLPSELYFEYTKQVREATAAFEAAARKFAHEIYPQELEAAKARLGPLFKASDYPTEQEIEAAHRSSVHFEPMPNAQDVRVWGIGDVAAREIEADVRNSVQAGIDAAHQHVAASLIERAQEFVEKIRAYDKFAARQEAAPMETVTVNGKQVRRQVRLSPEEGEQKNFRDTAVHNLREMVDVVLSGLNVKQDPKLTDLARALDVSLRNIDVEELHEKHAARKAKTAEVDRIASKFSGVFGPAKAAGERS